MKLSILGSFHFLVAASSAAAVFERDVCTSDRCAKAVTGSCRGPSAVAQAQADCSAFQAAQLFTLTTSGASAIITATSSSEPTITAETVEFTITDIVTIVSTISVKSTQTFETTETSTKSLTLSKTLTASSTKTLTITDSTQVIVHTDTISTSITTTVDAPDKTFVINAKRTAGPVIPPYASACPDVVAYASACSCWGIMPAIDTFTLPGVTATVVDTTTSVDSLTESDTTTQSTSIITTATARVTSFVTVTSFETITYSVTHETTKTLPVTVTTDVTRTTTSTTTRITTAHTATASAQQFMLQIRDTNSQSGTYNGAFIGSKYPQPNYGYISPAVERDNLSDPAIFELSGSGELTSDGNVAFVLNDYSESHTAIYLSGTTALGYNPDTILRCQITNNLFTCDPVNGRTAFGVGGILDSVYYNIPGDPQETGEDAVTLYAVYI